MKPRRRLRPFSPQGFCLATFLALLVAAGPYLAGAAQDPPVPGKKKTSQLAPGERVNLNTASQEDLERIPGIGPAKAKAIIKKRPFRRIEDIKKVKGIKDKTFQRIKDYLTVN